MSPALCLTRHCLGVDVRIECAVLPLAGDRGLWTLIWAAGLAAEQPSAIKAQGPFHGPLEAQRVLDEVAEQLAAQGYGADDDPPIWYLHARAELRRLNGQRSPVRPDRRSWPEV